MSNSKTKLPLKIREAKEEDISFMLALAEKEGWNPGLEDAGAFYAADPHGFFIGEVEGEKVGCVSGVAYNEKYGFGGLFIVKPEYRHLGYGIALEKKVLEYLKERCIGLDGVVAQQKNYMKAGFKMYYRNIRFEGKGGGNPSSAVINLSDIPIDMVLSYDLPIFGVDREAFLKKWIAMPNAFGLGKLEGERLVGYGVLRSCIKGFKIGPLFADDYHSASELFQSLSFFAKDASIYLDIPEINPLAMKLAEENAMQKVFETARMYTKNPPEQQLEKVYGITTFELG